MHLNIQKNSIIPVSAEIWLGVFSNLLIINSPTLDWRHVQNGPNQTDGTPEQVLKTTGEQDEEVPQG
jgi:hypothetical protein